MLTCRDVNELVTSYLEQRLSRWDRLRFRLHIALCSDCRRYVAKVRQLADVMGELPPEDEVPEDLMVRFRNWTASQG